MGVRVDVDFGDVWNLYFENRKRLEGEMLLLAENVETGYALYLTDSDGRPMLSVCRRDGEAEYEKTVVSKYECVNAAKGICMSYLADAYPDGPGDGGSGHQSLDEIASERETELLGALEEFMSTAANDYSVSYLDSIDGSEMMFLLEDVLMRIAEAGVMVYRPVVMYDDDTGKDVLVSFPYNDEFE